MLKLYILCASAAVVVTAKMENIVGSWYGVKFFPSLYDKLLNISECQVHNIDTDSGTTFTCDGVTTESMTYSFSGMAHLGPVMFVNSHAEALQELDKKHTCDGTPETPTFVQILDKGHFISYVGKKLVEPFSIFRLLFARTIPSESELNAYVETVGDLNDQTGHILCASDSPTPTTTTTTPTTTTTTATTKESDYVEPGEVGRFL